MIDQTFEKYDIRISVRGLVEFLLRNGDIDNRHKGGSELSAMQEGSRIHKMIQGKMGPNYEAEVPLFYVHEKEEYRVTIEGRADGIITTEEGVTIDEIKGTYRKLDKMKEPVAEHLAQAKCYGYMYGKDMNLDEIRIRLTYCNMETEEIRYFYEDFLFSELEKWFQGLLAEYDKWAEYKCGHYKERQQSIKELEFPFEYRPGQKELAVQVYQTIANKKKLFLEAPTGVGKTITTVFPSVKALGVGKADQIFYLTAKTITRTVAQEAFTQLKQGGLKMKSIIITAKEKVCFCEKTNCNPDGCEYAKGHLDRINEALYDLITSEDTLSRDVIERYAYKYKVCPFELSLDAALFADAVICDYNYLFDPEAKLKRFFADGISGSYIFLIDEAHNLLERGREMYSATLSKEAFVSLKRALKQTIREDVGKHEAKQITGQLSLEMNEEISQLPAAFESEPESEADSLYYSSGKKKRKGAKSILVRNGYADKMVYALDKCNKELLAMKRECDTSRVVYDIDSFVNPLNRFYATVSDYLEEHETHSLPVVEEILDLFFDVSHFLETVEVLDDNYIKYTQTGDDGSFILKLFCTNPRENLKACMKQGVSTILFSATFLPIQYYKQLLGGDPEDYEVYAKSVFDPENALVCIAGDVTSKYTRRSEEEFKKIAAYISKVVSSKCGNYMVFFPSYSFMHHVYDVYMDSFCDDNETCIMQQETMTEADRENFLEFFKNENGYGESVTGFCVLGGIFGEGIDLKADLLIGAIIVGTGLPGVCFERELLKEHFDEEGRDGFDYAYRYPGMNKVLQAAGRVIRTESDRGVIVLLDERFRQENYRRLFPREWVSFKNIGANNISDYLSDFWSIH